MRAVVFRAAESGTLCVLEDKPDPIPGRAEIVIKVRFAGINPTDAGQRSGRYLPAPAAPKDVAGVEVAGVVVQAHPSSKRFVLGDRVFGLVYGGGLAELVLADESHVARIPDVLSDMEAAATPEVFVTAFDAIAQGQLKPGELLAVVGASGGVGTAAVQLGMALGARVVAVARSDGPRRQLAEFGVDAIPPDRLSEYARKVGGVDVLLDLVGDVASFPSIFECLTKKARMVIVAAQANDATATINFRAMMMRRATIIGTTLKTRDSWEKASAINSFERFVVPLLASRRVVPVIDRVFVAADAAAAFDYLNNPGKFGRVLLDFSSKSETEAKERGDDGA